MLKQRSEFHQTSFFGYVVSPEGVAIDDRKVQAVLNWPRPTTVKEMQRFLRFANFYRRFSRDFSSIVASVTSMIKRKGSCLSWSPAANKAFNHLKERFSTAPILHYSDAERGFVVEIDASSTGFRAVLLQHPPKLFPCAYFSRKLYQAEQNYDGTVSYWQGRRPLKSGNIGLREPNFPSQFSLFFAIWSISALQKDSITGRPVQCDIMTEIAETQGKDPIPAEYPPSRTFVPLFLRNQVIQQLHDLPCSKHPGITASIQLRTNKFWWPSLGTDTIAFIKNCVTCNTTKSSKQLPAGLLQPLPVLRDPGHTLQLIFITDHANSRGNTTILTVTECFSKSCHLIPLPKLPTAIGIAEVLCKGFVSSVSLDSLKILSRTQAHSSPPEYGQLSSNASTST
ncbi:Retrovirus-related Pol polyprotein [Labeo rohita]|uniref:Gypsy retrotransposon integrase-like protein 1 n=1 Tax=Labeo rohita TaxID=84645 RepID=A0ABQ8LHM5_LABRO|nr:Retrovirus-related Pol polyprotein [Labeo rohita]